MAAYSVLLSQCFSDIVQLIVPGIMDQVSLTEMVLSALNVGIVGIFFLLFL